MCYSFCLFAVVVVVAVGKFICFHSTHNNNNRNNYNERYAAAYGCHASRESPNQPVIHPLLGCCFLSNVNMFFFFVLLLLGFYYYFYGNFSSCCFFFRSYFWEVCFVMNICENMYESSIF